MNYNELNKIFGVNVKENVDLSSYCTMKVGGNAKFFIVADTIDVLIKAVDFAQKNNIAFLILGGASNVIVGDNGFDGIVVLNRSTNIVFLSDKSQVIVDSGVSLMRLIIESANRDLGGLESLYGIPGTVGGAVYGNAGAFGVEICSLIKSVTVLTYDNKIAKYKREWLEAGYRSTKLKKLKREKKQISVILSVTFQLARHKKEDILRKIAENKSKREESQPYDKPSAGSIFKNFGKEKEKTAGFILDSVGAKKLKIGKAEVSKKHANFIVNSGGATSSDVIGLIEKMKELAHDNFGVELEEEVEII